MSGETLHGSLLAEVEVSLQARDWMERREGVARGGRLLRLLPDAEVVGRLAELLEAAAGDAKWEIRNEVAFAAQHLHHPAFERILVELSRDPNAFVRRSAGRSLKRRRQLGEQSRQREQEVSEVISKLGRLAARTSPEVAREAREIGRSFYGAVAASTVHDVRNVLTAIRRAHKTLGEELARRRVAKKAWQKTLEKADQRCRHIDEILTHLKNYSTQSKPEFQKVVVLDAVQEALGIVEDRFKGAEDAPQVEVEVRVPRHLVIDAPRSPLVQALTNVIRNSFEALDEAGAVRVEAERDGENLLHVRVIDDGCGVLAEDLDEVFMPGRSARKGRAGGDNTGWGLAIAQKIVESDCGGTIRMESEEGQGTTVVMELPIEQGVEEE